VPAEDLIRERNENGSFKDFYDFTKRINHKSVNKKTIESLIRCGALDSLKAGRKAMIENVEAFIDNAKKAQSKQNSGQLSLFSNSKVEINLAPSYINGEQDEYPERDLQAMEYELLGLFVNNHPMQAIQSLCKMITNHTLSSVKDLKDKAKVKVPVLLIDFVKKITKSKKIICIAQLEDLDDRIEGVIFSSKLGPVEHLLIKGKRLLVTGTLSKASEGNASIMIDSLEDLDDKAIVEFEVDMETIKDYFTFFQSLKSVLVTEPNRGENLVILNLKSGNSCRKMSLGATYKIKDCERLRENIRNMIRDFGVLNIV
jgi:DNA polymerase-3 subunit alpha